MEEGESWEAKEALDSFENVNEEVGIATDEGEEGETIIEQSDHSGFHRTCLRNNTKKSVSRPTRERTRMRRRTTMARFEQSDRSGFQREEQQLQVDSNIGATRAGVHCEIGPFLCFRCSVVCVCCVPKKKKTETQQP